MDIFIFFELTVVVGLLGYLSVVVSRFKPSGTRYTENTTISKAPEIHLPLTEKIQILKKLPEGGFTLVREEFLDHPDILHVWSQENLVIRRADGSIQEVA